MFQQCGYGFPNTPTIGPDASLPSMLAWITRRVAAYCDGAVRMEPSPDPDSLYRSGCQGDYAEAPRATRRRPLSTQLTRADKQALDLLADWPFSTPPSN